MSIPAEGFPAANFDDNEYPRLSEADIVPIIETMAPNEIAYISVMTSESPIVLRNPDNQLFLVRGTQYDYPEASDPDRPVGLPAPDWDLGPFIGIMCMQVVRADNSVIHGYIADVRELSTDFMPVVDFSDVSEEDAEAFSASVTRVLGIIEPDEDGKMVYKSADNASTQAEAEYFWQHTNSTRPEMEHGIEIEVEPLEATAAEQSTPKIKKRGKTKRPDATQAAADGEPAE